MRARRGRWAATLAAVLALTLAASAEAAKKKHKKHKTPSSQSSGKAEPAESNEPDEAPSGGSSGAIEGTKGASPKGGAGAGAATEEKPEGEGTASAPKKHEGGETEGGNIVPPALDLVVGGGALFRHMSWNQDVTNSFAPYSLSPGPELRLGLEVYPAAFAMDGFLANLGLFGGFNYGLAVTSKTSNGTMLSTKFQDFLAGIKLRIPFGNIAPYLSVAYGTQAFRLDGQSSVTVPAVSYKFIRPGIGARAWLTPTVDLDAGVAFVFVTDLGSAAGQIASTALLPKASAYGFDAGLSIGFRVFGPLALRVGGDFRQYGISGNSQTTDPVRLGGAADRYIVAWGGVEVLLDGLGSGASASGDEANSAAAADKAKPRPGAEPDLSDGKAE